MSKKERQKYEDDFEPEIVFCRATACRSNLGKGKCALVGLSGDDKVSHDETGRCENYFTD